MNQNETLRQAMNWLHTWLGTGLGSILFVIFWMGSLTVFHLEINKWMMPELRINPDINQPLDPVILPVISSLELAPKTTVVITRPNHRQPLIRLLALGGEQRKEFFLHPDNGEVIERTLSHGASGFFYPFHYSLHISWQGLGYWLVGMASIAMLVLIVSGIIIHRKIFQEFFTFRPKKQLRRASLDLHNLSGVIALPFHILFPLSGILIFALIYFPAPLTAPYDGDRLAYIKDLNGFSNPENSGQPGALPESIDSFVSEAEGIWKARHDFAVRADFVRIQNAGDANAKVMVQHAFPTGTVARSVGNIVFDVQTGTVDSDFQMGSVRHLVAFLEGAHFMRFDSSLLRWLLFFAGLAGAVMIATGLIVWLQSRVRDNHSPTAVTVVNAIIKGCVTGIIAASIAFMLVNRLLTNETALLGLNRADLEVVAFFSVWITSFIHATARPSAAWKEHCLFIAALALAAVLANWFSTGGHPLVAIVSGNRAVSGVDAVLLTGAMVAWYAAKRLGNNAKTTPQIQTARQTRQCREIQ